MGAKLEIGINMKGDDFMTMVIKYRGWTIYFNEKTDKYTVPVDDRTMKFDNEEEMINFIDKCMDE